MKMISVWLVVYHLLKLALALFHPSSIRSWSAGLPFLDWGQALSLVVVDMIFHGTSSAIDRIPPDFLVSDRIHFLYESPRLLSGHLSEHVHVWREPTPLLLSHLLLWYLFPVKYRGDLKKLEEFPLFPTPADMSSSLGPEKLPSVTHILSQTEPSENAYRLMMWRQRKINEMGRAAFLEYQNSRWLHTIRVDWCSMMRVHSLRDLFESVISLSLTLTHINVGYDETMCICILRSHRMKTRLLTSRKPYLFMFLRFRESVNPMYSTSSNNIRRHRIHIMWLCLTRNLLFRSCVTTPTRVASEFWENIRLYRI